VYDRTSQSFKDHADLLDRLYPQVAAAPNIETYARLIAQSPYIQDSDNRPAYEAALIRLYYDHKDYVAGARAKWLGIAALGLVLVGVILWYVLQGPRKFKDANDFFKNG
jgi:hypothetical protein